MTQPHDPRPAGAGPDQRTVVVVGPDGQPIGRAAIPMPGEAGAGQGGLAGTAGVGVESGDDDAQDVSDTIEQPAKVMRIGTMIKQLLEEVRSAPLDEASRSRLKDIYEKSIHELEQGLAPELRDELERLSLPFTEDAIPSDAELRIAQAQLVGWLEGLFQGLQTALFAQQMAARVQLEEMRRRALPPGSQPAQQGQGHDGGPTSTGQYL